MRLIQPKDGSATFEPSELASREAPRASLGVPRLPEGPDRVHSSVLNRQGAVSEPLLSRPTALESAALRHPRAQKQVNDDIQEILFTEEQIVAGIDQVAAEVTEHYRGSKFTVVSVLKGSCVFASDLIRRIPIPLELAFVSASSYGDGTVSGRLELNFFPSDQEVSGRRLLLVDDILDTGRTMSSLVGAFRERGAAEVRSCVFLDKPGRRALEYTADHRCFEVDDQFVVGYGLDYAGEYRNLPFVGALRPEIYQQGSSGPETVSPAKTLGD